MALIAEKPIQRTGPAYVKDCHVCDGIGKPGCPVCKGTGRIVRDLHPFVSLGSLQEHVGGMQIACGISFADLYGDGAGGKKPKLPIGSPAYHLRAIAEYAKTLFQQLVVMLPEEYDRTEGE
jgi:hypothetical protein